MMAPTNRAEGASLRTWMELVRLPNLFTAMADVTMGFLFTHHGFAPSDGRLLGLLLAASTSLYAAGVVLNDVFDAAIDARERPERPIPSGRVSIAAARWTGWGLLVLGVVLAVVVAAMAGVARPGIVGALLAGGVVLYDIVLKPTPWAPLGMGLCRALNVLLGMSLLAAPWSAEHGLAAVAVGVYIAGVTWLARGEARQGGRLQLALATVVVLAGIGLLAPLPHWVPAPVSLLQEEPQRWNLLLIFLGAVVGMRCLRAVVDPFPEQVQRAVVHCIHTLVMLDAIICYVVRDLEGALMVLLFLPPTMILGRFFRGT